MARFNWNKQSGSGSSMHYGNINSYTNSDGKYTGKYTGGLSSNYKHKSKYDSLFSGINMSISCSKITYNNSRFTNYN